MLTQAQCAVLSGMSHQEIQQLWDACDPAAAEAALLSYGHHDNNRLDAVCALLVGNIRTAVDRGNDDYARRNFAALRLLLDETLRPAASRTGAAERRHVPA